MQKHVAFHGFISDREKVSEIIRKYAIALAPYKMIPGSARLYGDATKIRAYMAAGLPTITTCVPPLGKEVMDAGAAIITDDTAKSIARAAIELFTNTSKLKKMKVKALRFAKHNTWENVYTEAFRQMR